MAPSIADELRPGFDPHENERDRNLDAIAFVRAILDARERADDTGRAWLDRSAVTQVVDPWIERERDAFDFAVSVGCVAAFALRELEDPYQVLDLLVRETVQDD